MAWLRGALRHFLLVPLILGLAGCFKSTAPLIDKSHASYPFQAITLEIDNEVEIVKREGDVYRRIENNKPRGEPLLIYEIEDGLYIVQEGDQGGEATYLFAKRQDDKVVVRSDCRGMDADVLASLNVQARKDDKTVFFECRIKDLDALIGLGKSPAIWSGETQTLQIVSME